MCITPLKAISPCQRQEKERNNEGKTANEHKRLLDKEFFAVWKKTSSRFPLGLERVEISNTTSASGKACIEQNH